MEAASVSERQVLLQERINFLERRLRSAVIFDIDKPSIASAVFGSSVLLENSNTGKRVTYQLVGSKDSDINEGRLSIGSPLGKAIIGKSIGDIISINAPGGKRSYKLLNIL